jgi:chromosome segregation ATPase
MAEPLFKHLQLVQEAIEKLIEEKQGLEAETDELDASVTHHETSLRDTRTAITAAKRRRLALEADAEVAAARSAFTATKAAQEGKDMGALATAFASLRSQQLAQALAVASLLDASATDPAAASNDCRAAAVSTLERAAASLAAADGARAETPSAVSCALLELAEAQRATAAAEQRATAAREALRRAQDAHAQLRSDGLSLAGKLAAARERGAAAERDAASAQRHKADADARLRDSVAAHAEAVAHFSIATGVVPPERLRIRV